MKSLERSQKLSQYLDIWFEFCCFFSECLFEHLFTCIQVVEELLSYYEALETETARGIADAAMLEVASITRGHMVCKLSDSQNSPEKHLSCTKCCETCKQKLFMKRQDLTAYLCSHKGAQL